MILVPLRFHVQTPDYRNNGKYQFVVGYTGGFAAEECVHLSFEEISERLQKKAGKGTLVDDGKELWWYLSTDKV